MRFGPSGGALENRRAVAYVPFKTFITAIEALEHNLPLPHQIDSSVWPSYSGAIRAQLLAAFKFLRLIDGSGKPTPTLKNLVENKATRKAALRKVLETSYPNVVGLDLTKMSPRQFDQAMREYGKSGETHTKLVSFFLQAAKYSELPISPLLLRKARTVTRKRRTEETSQSEIVGKSQAAEAVAPPPTLKTLRLRGGGVLKLVIEADLLQMNAVDRQLIFDLIDKIRDYETATNSMP